METAQLLRVLRFLPDLVDGALVTLQLGLFAAAIGLGLGLVLALGKLSPYRAFRWPASVYIGFFRTTPPLVQIVWFYYGLPLMLGYDLGPFSAAFLALGLNMAAFFAEVFRAGLIAVPGTQAQACRVLGLTKLDALRFVVLPQALRNVLPPTGTNVIYLVKSTALASAIGAPELLRVGQLVAVETFRPVETLTLVAVGYFILTYPIALLFMWIERRAARSRA